MLNSANMANFEDPFLWLEDVRGEKALDWVRERNARSEVRLTSNPTFARLKERLRPALLSDDRLPEASPFHEHLYELWQDAAHRKGLWRRTTWKSFEGGTPDWEILLDVDKLAADEGEDWVFQHAQILEPDMDRARVRLSRGGKDAVTVREFDLPTKRFVNEGLFVPEAKTNAIWLDRDHWLVATDTGPGSLTNSGYPRQIRMVARGQRIEDAPIVMECDVADVGLHPMAMTPSARLGRVVMTAIRRGFYETELWIGASNPYRVEIPRETEFQGLYREQALFLSRQDFTVAGKRITAGSLFAIPLEREGGDIRALVERVAVVMTPSERGGLEGIATGRDRLYVAGIEDIQSRLWSLDVDERGVWTKPREIPVPAFSTLVALAVQRHAPAALAKFESFLEPTTLFKLEGDCLRALRSLPRRFESDDLAVEQRWTPSRDGTKIPYFVVHKKDLKLDGRNPTILYGYGGFENAQKPAYQLGRGPTWLEEGGVYVLANIRGGGEFGPRWHQAALKENRQRAFDDFIAVAEDLIARKITSPAHLGIHGGSNGGLLVGACFTQRPDLFNAVVCSVPLLDMFRYHRLLAGASWMAEYGDPDKPEERAYIAKYSPYQNVSGEKRYPEVFFMTSTADDRVHPGHARKMAAKMEALGHPVLYRERLDGGHAGAADREALIERMAYELTYFREKLGLGPKGLGA